MNQPEFDLNQLLSGVDLNSMMAQVQEMQSQIQSAQEELNIAEFVATAGGGLVEATVLGTGELVGLVIKPEACDPEDTETLADLIVAACRKASGEAQAKMQQMMPQMPDFDIGQ